MTTWHTTCISDKDGKRIFRGTTSDMALPGEIRTLERHLSGIKNWHECYAGVDIDVQTAYISINGERLQTVDEILEELGKELDL